MASAMYVRNATLTKQIVNHIIAKMIFAMVLAGISQEKAQLFLFQFPVQFPGTIIAVQV